jgi:hypothetical protein
VVRSCPNCAARRLKRGPKRSVPLTIFPPDRPLEFIAMDILGPLPQTARGNRFVLCIGDRFTKLAVAVPLPDQTASSVAYAFVDRWIAYYGIPVTVLTDNGAAFASKFFRVLTNILQVKQVFTSAYRPATNGQIERWNATLVDALVHLATERDWDLHLGTACLSYNSSVHSSTGFAPIELSCTREPAPSVWCRPIGEPPRTGTRKIRYRHELLERAARLCMSARETNERRLERYKRMYDHHVRSRHTDLHVGDQVLVRTYVLEPGRSSKLSFPVAGPYPVTRIDGVNVEIRTREGTERLHLDRVMKCPVDLPSGIEWAPMKEPAKPKLSLSTDAEAEFVIDRFVSHAPASDESCWLLRVRWAGFGPDEDTWESAEGLPPEMIQKYERRKKLSAGTLTRRPQQ